MFDGYMLIQVDKLYSKFTATAVFVLNYSPLQCDKHRYTVYILALAT